jgi:tRNA threonylcarbamoyladenosine dehydratase
MSRVIEHPQGQGLSSCYIDRFSGIGRIYGVAAMHTFAQAHICVIGIGGVGAWCAEAIGRSGVGSITLVDLDEICVTNINRQVHALTDTIGKAKVTVMKDRMYAINPEVTVYTEQFFYTKKTEDRLLGSIGEAKPKFDLIIDAIDHTQRKAQLIEACKRRNIPVVTCGAAGGRRSPHMITCADLSQSTHDGLLRRVKKLLKKTDLFSSDDQEMVKNQHKTDWGVPAVFSKEHPYYPNADGGVCHEPPTRKDLRLDCNAGFGSLSFVTATFGFVAVSIALNIISNENPYG